MSTHVQTYYSFWHLLLIGAVLPNNVNVVIGRQLKVEQIQIQSLVTLFSFLLQMLSLNKHSRIRYVQTKLFIERSTSVKTKANPAKYHSSCIASLVWKKNLVKHIVYALKPCWVSFRSKVVYIFEHYSSGLVPGGENKSQKHQLII